MKAPAPRKTLAVLLGAGWLITAAGPATAQQVKIERCTPAAIRSGDSVEIHLGGRGLEKAKLWSSFPAEIERIDEKAPRFRITTDYTGPGAIRAHSEEGVSNLHFLPVHDGKRLVTTCEKKSRREDAQVLQVPCTVEGASLPLAATFYRFTARGGEPVVAEARSRGSGFDGVITIRAAEDGKRLAMADDSEANGADPKLAFVPPTDGDYLLELIDSQYRGGLGFTLSLSAPGGEPALEIPATVLHVEEEAADPLVITTDEMIYGIFDREGDVDRFRFDLPARTFLTVTPSGRSISSGTTPRLVLTDAEGKTLGETPHDSFDEQPLRLWLAAGDGYLLSIRDAFDRHGSESLYGLAVTTRPAPFELGIPGQRDKKHPLHDKFLAVPGGTFTVPVQCRRHGFDPAIALGVESSLAFTGENPMVGEKQGNVDLRVRVPGNLTAGTLATFRITGSAINPEPERTYRQAMETRAVLAERDRDAAIPPEVNGLMAVRIVEAPLTVEVTPPAELAAGSAANIPVTLAWRDGKRKFNTTLILAGLPQGAHTGEKKLNTDATATGLELKLDKQVAGELRDLRVQVRLDYHRQSLVVESPPFSVTIRKSDEEQK